MLSETNGKLATRTIDVMSSKMKALGRYIRCCHPDSNAHKTTDTDWLQGATMSVIKGKASSMMQYQRMKIDKLCRWMAQ